VAVVPGVAILLGFESIGESVVLCDGALCLRDLGLAHLDKDGEGSVAPERCKSSRGVFRDNTYDSVDTIHLIRSQLTDTMPVNSGAFSAVFVCHVHDNIITPASLEQWAWEGMVQDLTEWLQIAIRRKW